MREHVRSPGTVRFVSFRRGILRRVSTCEALVLFVLFRRGIFFTSFFFGVAARSWEPLLVVVASFLPRFFFGVAAHSWEPLLGCWVAGWLGPRNGREFQDIVRIVG